MRNLSLIFVIFCIFSFGLEADNWELFPYNQKTYFEMQNSFETTVAPYYVDFEEVQDDGILQFPLRNYLENTFPEACYSSLVAMAGNSYQFLELNATYTRPLDNIAPYLFTYRYYVYQIGEVEKNMSFQHQAKVGDTWEVFPSNSETSSNAINYSHLQITCKSINLTSIIEGEAIVDSVKTFQIQAFDGETAIASYFDGKPIRLSKKYGLLEWTAFSKWFTQDSYKASVRLIGLEDMNGDFIGEKTPLVADFFPYQVGDILKWERTYSPKNGTQIQEEYTDEILEVEQTSTGIAYIYNRTTTTTETELSSGVVIEASTTFGDNLQASEEFFPQHFIDLAAWNLGIELPIAEETDFLSIDLKKIEDGFCGSGYEMSLSETNCVFGIQPFQDNVTCDVVCVAEECYYCYKKTYQSEIGQIAVTPTNPFISEGYNELNLIEANIGDCIFSDIESPTYFANQITLHPNPTHDRFLLQLQNPKRQNLTLEVTDIHGRTVLSREILEDGIEVDLSDSSNGIYLVQLSDGKHWWTEKVVKY